MIRTLARSVLGRKGLGLKPDRVDNRDRLAASLRLPTSPPPSADLRRFVADVRDQGATSSCVAQAWTQALHVCDAQRGFAYRGPDSVAFHYWNARYLDGEPAIDDGTRLRSCAKAIIKWGRPGEWLWPFSILKINRKPAVGAYRYGYDDRGNHGYYRVGLSDLDTVRRALAAGHPIVGGWDIDDGFGRFDGRGVVKPGGKALGGHAMALVGYDSDGTFVLLNSWGPGYGLNGYAIVDGSFISRGHDGWIVAYS